MKLALHRSLSFWAGILVMVFICWAWWDSKTIYGGLLYHPDSHTRLGISNWHSEVEVFQFQSPPRHGPLSTKPRSLAHLFQRSTVNPEWSGSPGMVEGYIYKGFKVPHWLVLLATAIPWFALLFWRARRRQRVSGRA